MCGIVYVRRKDGQPAKNSVLKRYHAQKSRGSQGFGYLAIKDNKVVSYKRAQFEHEIESMLKKEDAPEILFHHRQPTHGPNIEELAHPLPVKDEKNLNFDYYVAHNGVIRNTAELKKKHEEMGFTYETEVMKKVETKRGKMYNVTTEWNDSESLAIETALFMDGKKTTIDSVGAAAVVGIQTKGDRVISRFFYRNEANPLFHHSDKNMITLTSLGRKDAAAKYVPSSKVQKFDDDWNTKEVVTGFGGYSPSSYTSYVNRYPASSVTDKRDSYVEPIAGYLGSGDYDKYGFLKRNDPDRESVDAWVSRHSAPPVRPSLANTVILMDTPTLLGEIYRTQTVVEKRQKDLGELDAISNPTSDQLADRRKVYLQIEHLKSYERVLQDEVKGREITADIMNGGWS